ncbi:MAG: hypothetical protein N3D80_12950 [Ignavibacterium album]|uniref:WD40/YVTN/BNR-like repeat-containing protein n=1 Tax=Ignavibacterium album TaxID=591197 RepID=UPI0026F1C3CE|nr:hypothetical protein [Ignavibacterium album]MCX8106767.1 hypothetical protein [Ignavibacterium album]
MKKIYILLTLFLSQYSFAQISSYKLGNELANLEKSNSLNPTSNTIIDIVAIGDTIWLGTSRGISLSFDRGETWTNFYGRSDFGTDNISAIGYNNYTRTFWCATAKSQEVTGGQKLPAGTGLKYTTDFGTTWNSVPQPVDGQNDNQVQYGINNLSALPVTVTVQNLCYDIAFTPNAIWIATFAGGLRRSTDNGQTWQRVVLPPDNKNSISPADTLDFCLAPVGGSFCSVGNLNHRVFSVIAVNDSTVLVGTANGINKTTNANDVYPSWVKFNHQNQENPISGNFITALAYNNTSNTIWASTWKAEDPNEFYGISFSYDGGLNWHTTLYDEKPHNFAFKFAQPIVLTDNGAFRSTDGGQTWILPNSIVDNQTGAQLRTNVFYSAAVTGNYIFLGSDDGLARLKENIGSVWEGEWKVYLASQPLVSDVEVYCYPNPFSPRQELLKFRYSTNGQEEKVTIRIYDFGFNYVATVIQNASRITDNEGAPDFWNGKDDNGNFVPNGVYFYRIEIGDKDPLFGKILVLQ